ncbi:thiamine phosphate synthase [Rhodosalinus sediminis]|uniref:Thiamine phosphate synthase n=1 Tax=Rhodosalinus sediminis TaxID=1940533 RepID=A0A3D9BX02_9RHOB|nr:thiamine phosphate synthase [Rhodosalinus sediminis]REC58028.1 thiamine phosphate synthase [Rhodosalinus sediminis]
MADEEQPQIYLVTPPEVALAEFAPRLEAVLDAHPVACLRLEFATRDADAVARVADGLREIAHARDVPLVVAEHLALVERLGLDGVHLTDGARSVRKAREMLGAEAIVGAFCGTSRHQGMSAGEAGADYIAFGPVVDTGLGDGTVAPRDLFAWWSEMIELPVVAEGALDAARIADLAPVADFFAVGEEIWRDADPAAALGALIAAMG